jgi:rhodanese-related sulfurtransferase
MAGCYQDLSRSALPAVMPGWHTGVSFREIDMASSVTAVPAASSDRAAAHFGAAFEFETDCADVHAALRTGQQDFVLLDVRAADAYAHGHVPSALHLPHGKIVAAKLMAYAPDTLFVVYCAGPHCNGAQRAAWRLAALGRPVKLMVGGVTGWLDEGFALAAGCGSTAQPMTRA